MLEGNINRIHGLKSVNEILNYLKIYLDTEKLSLKRSAADFVRSPM